MQTKATSSHPNKNAYQYCVRPHQILWITPNFAWVRTGVAEKGVENQNCSECPYTHSGFGIFEIRQNFRFLYLSIQAKKHAYILTLHWEDKSLCSLVTKNYTNTTKKNLNICPGKKKHNMNYTLTHLCHVSRCPEQSWNQWLACFERLFTSQFPLKYVSNGYSKWLQLFNHDPL